MALFRMLLDTGLRRSELAGLTCGSGDAARADPTGSTTPS
jgi:hypothetical protein